MITASTKTTKNDMDLCRKYTGEFFIMPGKLPVSYTYNGKAYKGLPADSIITNRFLDANIVETVITGSVDGELQIKAECLTYRDYPAVEWTVYFTCTAGTNKTKILENVLSMDLYFENSGKKSPELVYNNGDFYSENGYTVGRMAIEKGTVFTQAPSGGRPCDQAFPYQRVLFENFGVNISIGWPGQWSCEYRGGDGGFTFKAGQEISRTYIKSGETFRTPRMTLVFFNGDEARGINIWRRWFNAHVTPRQKGRILEPKAVFGENEGGSEWETATEEMLVKAVNYTNENFPGYNLFWVDAGWYPCVDANGKKGWPVTGDWYPDPERFPAGLTPVGKACKDAGIEFLVWFEPERVHPDSKFSKEHQDWILDNCLLNLGNPDCFEWLCGHVLKLIKDSGIVCYRQDFNIDPLAHWRNNETEDRKGMVENLHIQGFLAYWDYLLVNVPDLWIDSCASGGRRNDMETMRRAVSLHPTDYGYGHQHVNQAFRHTLQSWFPFTRGWSRAWDEEAGKFAPPALDAYKIINGFGALSFFASPPECTKEWRALSAESFEQLKKLRGIWGKYAEIELNGDFYALTENHRDDKKWTVFQFDSPESGEGVFQVLRNRLNGDEKITVKPRGFCGHCNYILTNAVTDETLAISGEEVNKHGLTFTQPARSGSVWFYKTV